MTPRDVLAEIEQRAVFHKPGVTAEDSRADVPALVAALRAVLDLHRPIADVIGSEITWCAEDSYSYPCQTVRAITDALNGVTDG